MPTQRDVCVSSQSYVTDPICIVFVSIDKIKTLSNNRCFSNDPGCFEITLAFKPTFINMDLDFGNFDISDPSSGL